MVVDLFTFGASIELARNVTGFRIDNLYFLFDLMFDVIFPWMKTQNENVRVGEARKSEADEVAHQCLGSVNERGEPGCWWIRYFGLTVRGYY